MNQAFDYNGVQVSPSRPVQKLVKRSRILHLDSRDRDSGAQIYPRNGEFTLYLPRTYERVIAINIKDAEFPSINTASIWDKRTNTGTPLGVQNVNQPYYILMEIAGLNMSDETALSADRSSLTNSVFAKFVSSKHTEPIIYNESSNAHQYIDFFPALTKLDRFQIRLRPHGYDKNYYLYWPSYNWSLSLDIETLENAFDDYSTIETRIADRS